MTTAREERENRLIVKLENQVEQSRKATKKITDWSVNWLDLLLTCFLIL